MTPAITPTTLNTWTNADNVRVFGGLLDSVWVGALGSVMPTAMDVPTIHKNIGWLSDDGLEIAFDDNTETFNGHQGGQVIRKKVTSSEMTFKFTGLESTLTQFGLIHNETKRVTAAGVTTVNASVAKKPNDRRSWIVDVWDGNLFYRHLFPNGETGERPTIALKNSEITAYEQTVTMYGDYTIITNDPAQAVPQA